MEKNVGFGIIPFKNVFGRIVLSLTITFKTENKFTIFLLSLIIDPWKYCYLLLFTIFDVSQCVQQNSLVQGFVTHFDGDLQNGLWSFL